MLFWHGHRALLRATRGRLGLWRPKPDGWGALRLTTTGRRTGRPRQVVIGYFEDGRNLITMAMNGWGAAEPAWWLNLQAHPDATAQTRDGARRVRARRAQGDERERLWSRWAEIDKNLDAYAALRPAETAVVVLEPRDTVDPAAGPGPGRARRGFTRRRRAMRSRDVRATTAGLLFIAAAWPARFWVSIAGLLVLFQSVAVLSSTQVVLNLPIAVQEMVLAVWLIVMGFSPKTKTKTPAPTAAQLHPA